MAVKRYDGSAWQTVAGLGAQGPAATSSSIATWVKTASGGETSLSGNDDNSQALSYTVGQELVFINGTLLKRGSDYTATNGTSITGLTALAANDVATVWTVNAFSVTGAIANTIVDAKGDLLVGTAADTPGRIAVGTNGQVLTAASTTGTGLTWATPAAGGGMTSIASGTLTGASVTISGISGSYKDLRLVIKNWKPATDNAICYGQLNADTGTNYYTTVGMDTNRSNQTFNSDFIYLTSFNDNSVAQGLSQSTFYEYANTTTWKMYEGICVNNHNTTTTNLNALYQNGFYNSTSAITEIKIYPSTGNHTSGDYILYGIN